jgi:hypothetical protein
MPVKSEGEMAWVQALLLLIVVFLGYIAVKLDNINHNLGKMLYKLK